MNRDVTYTIQLCADSYKTPPVPSSSVALYFYELIYLLWCFDSGNLEIKTEQKIFVFSRIVNCLWRSIGGVYYIPSTKNEQILNLCLYQKCFSFLKEQQHIVMPKSLWMQLLQKSSRYAGNTFSMATTSCCCHILLEWCSIYLRCYKGQNINLNHQLTTSRICLQIVSDLQHCWKSFD